MKRLIGTIIIAIAVIATAFILGKSYKSRGHASESISVVGSGEENFESDLIVWRANFSKKSFDLKEAYGILEQDRAKIKNYLVSKGLTDKNIVFLAVSIQKDISYNYDEQSGRSIPVFNGYNLSQEVKVESREVNKVEDISREVSQLINSGVELTSYAPEYYYTKLAQLKLKMIESATKDAKARAQKIADNAGGVLGRLKNAEMGVIQITGQNSTEDYSWGGSFNTSSKNKTASITIRLNYGVD